jgi:fructose-1,6-bisphosphatase I
MKGPEALQIGLPLQDVLAHDCAGKPEAVALSKTVLALAAAGERISRQTRSHDATHGRAHGADGRNSDGDAQLGLDIIANTLMTEALAGTPTAYFASEEEDAVVTINAGGRLAVAVDPLDGSSNISSNITIGSIFSIFPSIPNQATASFLRPGRAQLAAGFLAYGPHTSLVLSVGAGAHVFVLDDESGTFRLARPRVQIPATTSEFAINASNYRHWHSPVRSFIDDCIAGSGGPRGKDFNMRWVASLVAEAYRIMTRGGVFLYPDDARKGYERGRLRHVYEAAPIAFVVEQAGGRASDGVTPILDRIPASLHERTPLIFGSTAKVDVIDAYHRDPALARELSPLFRSRGLFTN